MKLDKIIIYTRGKNRDEFGNPYMAYKVVLEYSQKSYFHRVVISQSMHFTNNSSEYGCLRDALEGLNEFLHGIKHPKSKDRKVYITMKDKRIIQFHKHVSRDCDLEHPESWREDDQRLSTY